MFTYPDLFRHLSENINKTEKPIPVIVGCWVKPLKKMVKPSFTLFKWTETTQMTLFI